jgi:hypothetical protein
MFWDNITYFVCWLWWILWSWTVHVINVIMFYLCWWITQLYCTWAKRLEHTRPRIYFNVLSCWVVSIVLNIFFIRSKFQQKRNRNSKKVDSSRIKKKTWYEIRTTNFRIEILQTTVELGYNKLNWTQNVFVITGVRYNRVSVVTLFLKLKVGCLLEGSKSFMYLCNNRFNQELKFMFLVIKTTFLTLSKTFFLDCVR